MNPILKRILEAVPHFNTLEADEQEELTLLAETLLEELDKPVLSPKDAVHIKMEVTFHRLGSHGIQSLSTDALLALEPWEHASPTVKAQLLKEAFDNCTWEIVTHVKHFIST